MAQGICQVIFPNETGIPEDVFVNTFAFLGPGGGAYAASDAEDAMDNLESFYNGTHAPGTGPLGEDMASCIDRANCRMKFYDLNDVQPRTPVATRNWTLAATVGTTDFPNEVALCLSYNATLASGDDPRTHRGRIFIGPLRSTVATLGTGDTVPGAGILNEMAGAASFLAAQTGNVWSVWSRKDDILRPIQFGHIDNAFDIQRRRGKKATARTLWT